MSSADTERPEFVTNLFLRLDDLEYAIERGLREIDAPLVSDLDVIIRREDMDKFIKLASEERLLLHVVNTFGGARVFIGRGVHDVKRVDFMWLCHYRGIHLLDLKPLLGRRKLDPVSKLYVLAEDDHARVLFAVKNAYGGAEKYRSELSNYGFPTFGPRNRINWLVKCFLSEPIRASVGAVSVALAYAGRLIRPSGLSVFGTSANTLNRSSVIRYIFQGRVQQCSCLSVPYLAGLGAALCVVTTRRCAQLDLSSCSSLADCEQEVVATLRARCRAGD